MAASSVRLAAAPRLESLFVATIVLFGFRVGLDPISDNSMFTHLRTGIDMVAGEGIPRVDPYSFTALGHRWVVQSWLPEWTYGWADRIGGPRLVVFEQALLTALLAYLIVRLARAETPLRTALSGILVLGIGFPFWSPRPLLFGLVCMALTVAIVERRRSPWLLIPVVWLWVQSHGSFPLGLVWLGAHAVGEGIDWRAWPGETWRYVYGFVAGLAVSIVNPLGAKLLTFPLTLGSKSSIFENIVEWQSPNFQKASGRVALVFIVLALSLLVRARLQWRDVVPVVVFFAASLFAVRNLPVAAIVIAPCLGRVLKKPEGNGRSQGPSGLLSGAKGPSGLLSGAPARSLTPRRLRMLRLAAGAIAAGFVLLGLSALTMPAGKALAFGSYPKDAVTVLQNRGLLSPPHRIANEDFVGNYLTLRYGDKARDFIDDRYDMFPTSVSEDYLSLLNGRPAWQSILDRHGVDVVLWDRDKSLAGLLAGSDKWQKIYDKGQWVAYQRVTAGK